MKLIVGNWKMNGTQGFARALVPEIAKAAARSGAEVVLCPPFILLSEVAKMIQATPVKLGAQDCSPEAGGAFTGDISASMLRDSGCAYVIVGHSERRQGHGETSELVAKKTAAALAAGLIPIVCVGETLAEREAGKAREIVASQLFESAIIAYEPVWAIGTGKTPTTEQIAEMHAYIVGLQPGAKVLYGGSVKAQNAQEILAIPGVSGVLVGGASLKAEEFIHVIPA